MIPNIPPEELERMIRRATERARRVRPNFKVAPPIDLEKLRPLCTGPTYERFEEDVIRMRRGLPPIGPEEHEIDPPEPPESAEPPDLSASPESRESRE
jgi:hypothetical protein